MTNIKSIFVSGLIYYLIIKKSKNSKKLKKFSQITEKGIYLDGGFYTWKKIKNYRWVSEDTIKFEVKCLLSSFDVEIELQYDNKNEINQIVQKYISPYSCKK